eukprot:CAMPEP_0202708190 /NCGR_PEP_ID=MMETSP1385-20130828/20444_1 /ASSEMBLY_ACC=CAM_ASM_000861 /TAXON_ID=933848 /ORGANISM="Elphidium margaritaceum" /LENGTH=66 /DNA_ID=CAMNT_0049367105 /DNA_START=1 /DNA_END=197 /DNA_ORIENTATION=+
MQTELVSTVLSEDRVRIQTNEQDNEDCNDYALRNEAISEIFSVRSEQNMSATLMSIIMKVLPVIVG